MGDQGVLVSISDMIDLAIGSPEVGVVDFNMLQTVLHCLAQQMRVLGKNVELHGSFAQLPVFNKDNVQTIAISEFIVDVDKDSTSEPSKTPRLVKKQELPFPGHDTETILVVERVKKYDSPTNLEGRGGGGGGGGGASTVPHSSKSAGPGSTSTPSGTATSGGGQTASTKPAGRVVSGDRLSLVTTSKFNLLESAVEDLKNRVYGSIPKNEDILQEVRSQTNMKAITDMWTNLNVSSRLEAAEAGIGKLSSLVEDLIGESTGIEHPIRKKLADATADADDGGQDGDDGAPGGGGGAPGGGGKDEDIPEDLGAICKELKQLRHDMNKLYLEFYSAMDDAGIDCRIPEGVAEAIAAGKAGGGGGGGGSTGPEDGEGGGPEEGGVEEEQGGQPVSVSGAHVGGKRFGDGGGHLLERVIELERKIGHMSNTVGKSGDLVQDHLSSFQDQLEDLQKQVATLTSEEGPGKLSPDLVKDLQGLMELFKTVQDMQGQLQQVHDTAMQLAAEKEDREHHINALLEQIELLKTIKLDREDMLEAMADKADLRMLARKVSHDQFELACDDLSKGLEHALGKLGNQEELWQQALDDIQREIETKLDKMELSPVKEFFNTKLKQLQDNLKQMASLRREVEAAGTKRRLLRDVNCISCDAKAVMAMDSAQTGAGPKPVHATMSMKPYLTYELDAIRKSQASHVPQRNMHDWENIDKQMTQTKPHKVRQEGDKHLCNRYCGGSHTVTTAAQRVARLGHFIKQWGPDVLPLSSGLAAGDDGKMYKVSPVDGVPSGPGGAVDNLCEPKPQHRKPSITPKTKPVVISAECRCLDGDTKFL